MHLRWEFPNGYFGDPALYIWELNTKNAVLFDCGDLSRFTTRQLLRVSHIFLSHCHIDHFYGFDHFLRIHVGSEKSVTIMGPPETIKRVAGKLQGYTWNLVYDQNLEFKVVELDTQKREQRKNCFHAKNLFEPSSTTISAWDPIAPIYDSGTFKVFTATIDHRTPSMSYAIEEKINVAVNSAKLYDLGFNIGPWLYELKMYYLNKDLNRTLMTTMKNNVQKEYPVSYLVRELLIPRYRHKLAYATDGAPTPENRSILIPLIKNTDIFFCETCFLEQDRPAAETTKHFTAKFIGQMAREAGVKRLIPFHFSKRYLDDPQSVEAEVLDNFYGKITHETSVSSPTNFVRAEN